MRLVFLDRHTYYTAVHFLFPVMQTEYQTHYCLPVRYCLSCQRFLPTCMWFNPLLLSSLESTPLYMTITLFETIATVSKNLKTYLFVLFSTINVRLQWRRLPVRGYDNAKWCCLLRRLVWMFKDIGAMCVILITVLVFLHCALRIFCVFCCHR